MGAHGSKSGVMTALAAQMGGLVQSQAVTVYITAMIYLALDRFSGKGPDIREVAPTPMAMAR